MSTHEKRIFGFVCISGAAAGSVAFLVVTWLAIARARREPAYARYLRYATLVFVPWFALMFGLAFVVPEGWVAVYALGGVALLVLLGQLAKRLARPSASSPAPPS